MAAYDDGRAVDDQGGERRRRARAPGPSMEHAVSVLIPARPRKPAADAEESGAANRLLTLLADLGLCHPYLLAEEVRLTGCVVYAGSPSDRVARASGAVRSRSPRREGRRDRTPSPDGPRRCAGPDHRRGGQDHGRLPAPERREVADDRVGVGLVEQTAAKRSTPWAASSARCAGLLLALLRVLRGCRGRRSAASATRSLVIVQRLSSISLWVLLTGALASAVRLRR